MGERRSRDAPEPLDPAALQQRALRLLARRERSRAELERLLAPLCGDAAVLAAVLDELQARGWLSEARLADQVIASRRSRASAAQIRQRLALRGVAPEVIAEATAGLEQGDLEAALALWRRRFGSPAVDRASRERQLRFLLHRGFDRGVALKVLRLAEQADAS